MLQTFARPRPKIMVVSHERSGTHFMMNAIAKCYGYVARPWLNFDFELGLNFYYPQHLAAYFGQFANIPLANVVKAHHSFAFFKDMFASLIRDFHVIYVYRDPRDVMVSYWKFLNQLSWHEGPKTATCSEFLRSAPAGQMMRYQYQQEDSVLHRWLRHVNGWTLDVPEDLKRHVTYVRFRDLARDFENVMLGLADPLGEAPSTIERPALHENTVLPNAGVVGAHKEYLTMDDLHRIHDIAGTAMARLGFI